MYFIYINGYNMNNLYIYIGGSKKKVVLMKRGSLRNIEYQNILIYFIDFYRIYNLIYFI